MLCACCHDKKKHLKLWQCREEEEHLGQKNMSQSTTPVGNMETNLPKDTGGKE